MARIVVFGQLIACVFICIIVPLQGFFFKSSNNNRLNMPYYDFDNRDNKDVTKAIQLDNEHIEDQGNSIPTGISQTLALFDE